MSLGPEVYLSGEKRKRHLRENEIVQVSPGQLAVFLTEETLSIPTHAMGFISLKSRAKLPGLINVSGFHVDPGYQGRLMFTVYNAGTETCTFARGDRLFLLWIADMDQASDPYRGKNQGLQSIRSDVIERLTAKGASPAELERRITALEKSRTVIIAVAVPIIVGLLLWGAKGAIGRAFAPTERIPQRQLAPTPPDTPTKGEPISVEGRGKDEFTPR